MWLLEGLYAIEMDVLCFIGSSKCYMQKKFLKIACKIRDKKVIKPFRDRRTEIVAFRGAICNRNGCPLFHWIIEMLYAKKVPYSRDEKVISLDKVISF